MLVANNMILREENKYPRLLLPNWLSLGMHY